MKNLSTLFSLCTLITFFSLISCQAAYIDFEAPTVTISQLESENPEELSILFTPSPGTTTYKYAISASSDFSSFNDNSMEGICVKEGDEAYLEKFSNLTPGQFYYIYAQAYNADQISGGLAAFKVLYSNKNVFNVVQQYNLSTSAAFVINYPPKYVTCRYYLGTENDREAFLDGSLEGTERLYEIVEANVVSYFNLEENSKHVFYAQATDILGLQSELIEIPFTTPTKDQVPYAEMEIVHQDAFRECYKLTPNAECGKIICLFNEADEGAVNLVYSTGWGGDWMGLILSWSGLTSMNNIEFRTYSATGEPVEISYDDYTFSYFIDKTMQAVLFDKDGKTPIGVQNWNFNKPEMPSQAKKSHVTLKVSDITAAGAKYTYVADENTLGFFFDTVDADWWDENKDQLLAKDKYYLHNLLKKDHIFCYPPDYPERTFEFTEALGEPGKRYYAIACPANMKGIDEGWDELVIVEYVTSEK